MPASIELSIQTSLLIFQQIFFSFSFLSSHFNSYRQKQLPVLYGKSTTVNGGGTTSIPLPQTVSVTRRCPPDKIRPLPPTPDQSQSKLISSSLSFFLYTYQPRHSSLSYTRIYGCYECTMSWLCMMLLLLLCAYRFNAVYGLTPTLLSAICADRHMPALQCNACRTQHIPTWMCR